jgi:hypothetical protein
MSPLTRITNDKFSVSICHVAQLYGFKTIGSLVKFLKQCQPYAKLSLGVGHVRVAMLLRQIDRESALIEDYKHYKLEHELNGLEVTLGQAE